MVESNQVCGERIPGLIFDVECDSIGDLSLGVTCFYVAANTVKDYFRASGVFVLTVSQ